MFKLRINAFHVLMDFYLIRMVIASRPKKRTKTKNNRSKK